MHVLPDKLNPIERPTLYDRLGLTSAASDEEIAAALETLSEGIEALPDKARTLRLELIQEALLVCPPMGTGLVSRSDSRMRWQTNHAVFLLKPSKRPI